MTTPGPYLAIPFPPSADTVAALQAMNVSPSVSTILVDGYYAAGDLGAATYKRVASEPTHAGKIQSADGTWWELTTTTPNAYMFGAKGDGATSDATKLQNLFDYAAAKNTPAYLPAGNFVVPTEILTVATNVQVIGCGRDSQIWRTKDVPNRVFSIVSQTAVVLRDFQIQKTALLTSSTSRTVASSGSLTFTVSSDASTGIFPYSVGQYITIKPFGGALGTSANYMIGTVSSYTGTTLVVSLTGSSGSGTFSNWYFATYTNDNCAVVFEGCTDCVMDGVFVTGSSFYVGLESLNGNYDVIQNCTVNGVWNRGLYIYSYSGASIGVKFINNTVNGSSFTDYAINCNGSTAGYITAAIIQGNNLTAALFDGIVVGGYMQFSNVVNNNINGVFGLQGSTYVGVGILVEEANTYQASYNVIADNVCKWAYNIGIATLNSFAITVTGNNIFQGGTGLYALQSGSTYSSINNSYTGNVVMNSTTNGIAVAGTASFLYALVFTGNVSSTNGTNGFLATSDADRITVTGNVFYANTGTNYSNSATNSIAAGNITS